MWFLSTTISQSSSSTPFRLHLFVLRPPPSAVGSWDPGHTAHGRSDGNGDPCHLWGKSKDPGGEEEEEETGETTNASGHGVTCQNFNVVE